MTVLVIFRANESVAELYPRINMISIKNPSQIDDYLTDMRISRF